MSVWANISKRAEGSELRKEEFDPEFDELKKYTSQYVRKCKFLINEIKNLKDEICLYSDFYCMEPPENLLYPNPTEILQLKYKGPEDKNKVAAFNLSLVKCIRNLQSIHYNYQAELHRLKEMDERIAEDNKRRMEEKERERKIEKEQAKKDKEFLDRFDGFTTLFIFSTIIFGILSFIFLLIGGTEGCPVWCYVPFFVFLFVTFGFGVWSNDNNNYEEKRERVKKYLQ